MIVKSSPEKANYTPPTSVAKGISLGRDKGIIVSFLPIPSILSYRLRIPSLSSRIYIYAYSIYVSFSITIPTR